MSEYARLMPHLLSRGPVAPLLVLLLVLLGQVLVLLPPYLVGQTVDRIGSLAETTASIALLAAVAFLNLFASPFQAKLVTGFVQRATLSFSVECTEKIFTKNYNLFKSANVGGLLKRSERGIEGFESFLGFLLVVAIPACISVLLVSGYLAYLGGWQVVLFLLGAALVFVVVTGRIVRWRRPYLDRVNDAEDELAEVYSETFLAGVSLKASNRIDAARTGLEGVYETYSHASTALSFATGVLAASQGFISTFALIAVIGIGAMAISSGNAAMTAGDFIVMFSYVSIFMSGISQIMEVRKKYDEYQADIAELDRVLRMPVVRQNLSDVRIDACALTLRPFRYEEGPALYLRETLTLRRGETVAVIGKTGSGKTSLLEIMSGVTFLRGTVFLDETDMGTLSEKSAAGSVFYAPQHPRFLAGGFSRAVLFGQDIPPDTIRGHLDALMLDRFRGLITSESFPVSQLSGGEARRFALLRALVAPQPIVILDEPTGELDRLVADRVWDCLFASAEGKLLICATHDTQILDRFDHVLEVTDQEVRLSAGRKLVGRS